MTEGPYPHPHPYFVRTRFCPCCQARKPQTWRPDVTSLTRALRALREGSGFSLLRRGLIPVEGSGPRLCEESRGQADREDRSPRKPQSSTEEDLPVGLLAQLLLTVPTAALTRVIMALEQKSLHGKPDEDLEAQGEDLGLVGTQDPTDEEQEATSSYSQEEEVSAAGPSSPSQSPQGGPVNFLRSVWSQFHEGFSSQQEEGPSTWVNPAHLESSFQEVVNSKVGRVASSPAPQI
ncbi:Melanoma-associated antigen 11 [Plecturocebus cupreus]